MNNMEKVAGNDIEFDAEGFMLDYKQWNRDIAKELGDKIGLELNDRHFVVVDFMREEYEKNGQSPTLRSIGKRSGVAIKELYQLFPKGPAKKAAFVAGLPKPKGCI